MLWCCCELTSTTTLTPFVAAIDGFNWAFDFAQQVGSAPPPPNVNDTDPLELADNGDEAAYANYIDGVKILNTNTFFSSFTRGGFVMKLPISNSANLQTLQFDIRTRPEYGPDSNFYDLQGTFGEMELLSFSVATPHSDPPTGIARGSLASISTYQFPTFPPSQDTVTTSGNIASSFNTYVGAAATVYLLLRPTWRHDYNQSTTHTLGPFGPPTMVTATFNGEYELA